MTGAIVAMLVVLVAALGVMGVVLVGMQGRLPRLSARHPELQHRLVWAARHLNGEAETPQRFEKIFH